MTCVIRFDSYRLYVRSKHAHLHRGLITLIFVLTGAVICLIILAARLTMRPSNRAPSCSPAWSTRRG